MYIIRQKSKRKPSNDVRKAYTAWKGIQHTHNINKKSPERMVIASGKWHLVKRQQQQQQPRQQHTAHAKPNFSDTKKGKPLFSTSNVEHFLRPQKAWEFVRFQIYFFFFCRCAPLSVSINIFRHCFLVASLLVADIFAIARVSSFNGISSCLISCTYFLYKSKMCREKWALTVLLPKLAHFHSNNIPRAHTKRDPSTATRTHTLTLTQ